MKKYLILVLFLAPLSASAIEGTCSWHGGVNCSVGSDWDGSAVCNDGWRDSSELYSQMLSCKVDRHYCTADESAQIDLKYSVAEKRAKVTDISNQLAPISAESVSSNNASILRDNAIKASELLSKFYIVQADYSNARSQATEECFALGDTAYYKSQVEFLKQLQSQSCQTKYGINSYNANNSCYCSTGYQFDTEKASCVSTQDILANFINNSPYPNIVNRKIYSDVRTRYAYNSDVGCVGLLFKGEDLAMCQAFAAETKKELWYTIDRPDTTVTVQSLLEKKQRESATTQTITPSVPIEKIVAYSSAKIETAAPKQPKPIFVKNTTTSTVPTEQLTSRTSTTTPAKVATPKAPAKKHWYQWLNPFSWFK